MCECRSPRMSASSISSGSSSVARRLQLAAVLAQLGLDVLHAEPLVDLLLGRAGVASRRASSSTTPYSLTCRPRLTAAVRSASLCLPEPVKCWSRLPKFSSGTMRRSTGRPVWVIALAPASPGRWTASTSGSSAKASTSACGSSVAAHDVEVLAGVGHAPRAAGELDALRRVRRAGPRRAPRRSRAPSTAACRGLALPSAPAASASSTFSSAFAPKPGTSPSCPVLGDAAQVVERLDAELRRAAGARAWARGRGCA